MLAKLGLESLARLDKIWSMGRTQPSGSVLVQQEFKGLGGIFLPDVKNAVGSKEIASRYFSLLPGVGSCSPALTSAKQNLPLG